MITDPNNRITIHPADSIAGTFKRLALNVLFVSFDDGTKTIHNRKTKMPAITGKTTGAIVSGLICLHNMRITRPVPMARKGYSH